MPGSMRKGDPYLSFHFRVEIDGIEVGGFSEVTGLQIEVEMADWREGGNNEFLLRFVGPAKHPANLVLKHGIMDANVLWSWQREIMEGRIQRRNAAIVLLDSAGKDKRRWGYQDVCPVRWSGPDLRAGSAEVAVETLELTHRGYIPS
jgi:phage tail-like protein